ncbi:hypothetical protein NEF87_003947 [Candidatus Lokiarchaeum ossiferum]|uniref:Uncharacterized protein n=1 Tax=Candidatus Lokiarchaeum ossiferum TaxID=2951803 RepID=A0ABY6HZA1_9ARCH|nr:hypothetical protein NEF87_003947 [Candidatus Lokiarchaeum sp. B-35]
MVTQKKFFKCNSCGLEQNLDQSVHITLKYCVSCYNKEQIHRESMRKINMYIALLKEKNKYSKIRRQKIQDIIRINELILPLTIFQLEDGEVLDYLHESRRNAFKSGLKQITEKYNLSLNPDIITHELINKLEPIWKFRRVPTSQKLDERLSPLDPFIDKPIKEKQLFFKDIKKAITMPYFTKVKGKYLIKQMAPFKFKDSYILKTIKTYRKAIEKAATQPEQFRRFLKALGMNCQFQTIDDRLKLGIQEYARDVSEDQIKILTNRMISEIDQAENSFLIPNIAKHIMDNHERLFEKWFCYILPFDKSRFMSVQAKTGSRTDFVVRLQYHFRKYELKMIYDALWESSEYLVRAKTEQKLAKIKKDSSLAPEQKKLKIAKALERLEKNLAADKLQQTREQNAKGSPMVARFLLLNSEKAFNMVLDKIIRYHYKRLNLTTPVSYITNVLESGAEEKKGELKAFYMIQSREW